MADAEDYALWIDTQNTLLKNEAERLKISVPVAFAFGGASFGAGVPLIVEGIRTDNRTMTWAGVGTIAISGGIWALGHYLFGWW